MIASKPTTILPLLLSFYSHKGGVGKTTCIHNIANILAKEFKIKILLVDLDTQGSLTGLVMRKEFEKLGEERLRTLPKDKQAIYKKAKHRASLGEDYFMETNREKRTTIYEIFKGEKSQNCRYHLKWVEKNYNEVLNEVEPVTINQGKDNEFLFIPGDLRIRLIESEVSEAISTAKSQANFADYYSNMPGVISHMLRDIGKKFEVDMVLLDFSPSPTPFNQAAFMGSDYFIVNNLADFLSRRSIKTLSTLIDEWEEFCKEFRSEALGQFKLPPSPKFLGPVISRVKLHSNDITLDKRDKIDLIKAEIETYLKKFLVDNKNSCTALEDPPLIRDFNRLGDKAEETGIPICYIQPTDIPKESKKYNMTDASIIEGSNLFLNSYFAAIVSLFSNLSEAHHVSLRNVFRLNISKILPQENSTINGPIIKDEDRKIKLTKGEAIEVSTLVPKAEEIARCIKESSVDLSNDIYYAFCQALRKGESQKEWKEFIEKNKILNRFKEYKEKFQKENTELTEEKSKIGRLFKDLKGKNSLISHILARNLSEDPQLCKLTYRVSPHLDPKEKKENKMDLGNENGTQDSNQITKEAEKATKNYLDAYRRTRNAASILAEYLRQNIIKEEFISLASNYPQNNLFGDISIIICAEAQGKKYRLWGQNHHLNKAMLLEEASSQKTGEITDLLCEKEAYQQKFYKLMTESTQIPIKTSSAGTKKGNNQKSAQQKSKPEPKSEPEVIELGKRRHQSRDKTKEKSKEDEKIGEPSKKVKTDKPQSKNNSKLTAKK